MIYFISDVHLGFLERERDIERESLFINLLDSLKSDCTELFFLGDIFDYWFEYKTVIPAEFYRSLAKIHELRQEKIKITYIMGNHDFGHKDFFKREFDIDIISSDISREINGKKFYLSHGDGKSKNDRGYLILRAILRNRFTNALYRIIHPDIGIKLAGASSKKSRNHTDSKDFGEKDGMREFAKSKIEEGYDFVIMGHRHQLIEEIINKGRYINLGHWFSNAHFGKFDGNDFQLIKVEDFLNNNT